MGFEDPICGPGGTTTTCARDKVAHADESTAARQASRTLGEDVAVMGNFPFGPSKDAAHYTRQLFPQSRTKMNEIIIFVD
jgi:hypothetical protein